MENSIPKRKPAKIGKPIQIVDKTSTPPQEKRKKRRNSKSWTPPKSLSPWSRQNQSTPPPHPTHTSPLSTGHAPWIKFIKIGVYLCIFLPIFSLINFINMIFITFIKHKPKYYCTLYKRNTEKSIFLNWHPPKIPVENGIPKKIPAKIGKPIKIVDKTSTPPQKKKKEKKKEEKKRRNSKFWTPPKSLSPWSRQNQSTPLPHTPPPSPPGMHHELNSLRLVCIYVFFFLYFH